MRVPLALASAATLLLLTGCSGSDDKPDAPTREPAAAAVAPVPTAAPAGRVVPVGRAVTALVSDPGTGQLAALDGATVLLIDPATGAVRTVALPAPGASLALGAPGEVLVAAPQRIVRVQVAAAAVSEIPVEGDVRSVLNGTDGTVLAGTADGRVRTLAADGAVLRTVTGLVSADVLARTPDHLAVLDRHQSSITEIDPGAADLGLAQRAGDGATMMIADHFGRVLVTDSDDNELLVYSTGPLLLRQRFPVGSSPYALAYDQRSETVWVTCTQSNEVVGFDLGTGIPVEVGRYPAVRQPNSVTVDERTGDLFVGSATGDGVQRIPAEQRKRGQ
ncbi:YncE family protein [Nocardia sp. NPDC127579]|uniref:YncE family protein n=1 Tax=Nocardia sp. NPDC127579 TaxID=3345402 RepID=UPI00362DB370